MEGLGGPFNSSAWVHSNRRLPHLTTQNAYSGLIPLCIVTHFTFHNVLYKNILVSTSFLTGVSYKHTFSASHRTTARTLYVHYTS